MKDFITLYKRELYSHYTAESGIPLLYTLSGALTVFFCRIRGWNALDSAVFLLIVSALAMPFCLCGKPFFTRGAASRKTADARYFNTAALIAARYAATVTVTLKTLLVCAAAFAATGRIYAAPPVPLADGIAVLAYLSVVLSVYSVVIASVCCFKLLKAMYYALPLLFVFAAAFSFSVLNLDVAETVAAYRYKLPPLAAAAALVATVLFVAFLKLGASGAEKTAQKR